MRYRSEIQSAAQFGLQASILSQIEAEFSETSTNGLLNKLDEFWAGWQRLSADPSNSALKAELVDVANTLTQSIQYRALNIRTVQADQNLQISQRVDSINQLAEQVARLNGEIMRVVSIGEQPNDLMDQRDVILDELAKLSGATSALQSAGDVIVSINGHVLVQGVTPFELQTQPDPVNPNLFAVRWSDGQSFNPSSGELAGLFSARNGVLGDQMQALNDLSGTIISRVNALHLSGYAPGKTNTLVSNDTIQSIQVGVLAVGQTEFASDNYYVETRLDAGTWQFRMVDSTGNPVSIQLSDLSGYSNDWQDIPTAGGLPVNYDTGRGITMQFGGDVSLYTETSYTTGAASVQFYEQQEFFTGTDALTIAVNSTLLANPYLLATATAPNQPGNGDLARALANVRTENLMSGGLSTINQFYTAQTARFGVDIRRAKTNAADRLTVANVIDQQRQSISGVNLNEEAANLIKAQKAFEASARLMTVIDEMMNTIINGMGIVGR
jgi:flagellar hook-associated protein 1 FlgK